MAEVLLCDSCSQQAGIDGPIYHAPPVPCHRMFGVVNGKLWCLDCGDLAADCTCGGCRTRVPLPASVNTGTTPTGREASGTDAEPLRDWIRRNGEHARDCAKMSQHAGTPSPASFMPCTCGLAELLSESTTPAGRQDDSARLDWMEEHAPNVSFAVTPQSGPWLNVGINESLREAIDRGRGWNSNTDPEATRVPSETDAPASPPTAEDHNG